MFSRRAVDVQKAAELVDDGWTIVDVRTAPEWREAHVPGSVHVILDSLPHRVSELHDKKVLAFCRSGNRSATATRFLEHNGIEALNVTGGIIAWARAGLPIEKGT